ncbi:DUF732 domain-containing protein [Mycobacterium ahvazicum]|uniref:DUF732 domain-containing protein n=1 Tax=Mycobacterium ahvazicum TaxID=1964395 RepID=A0A2K4YEN7_9MYCO|nr:DUF732 domain-containing protein [Mycobacterium ahvazicum]SOX55250.1 DUF732 domain-containing protein [Mycobacterium ahvazicum]
MKLTALISCVLAVLLIPTGVARADSNDDNFVKVLADQGITGDPNQLVTEGHTACDDISNAHLATSLPRWTRTPAFGPVMGDLGLSVFQAGFFISAAESAYCPQFLGVGR